MKKILVVLALVLLGSASYAQWSGGPGNLFMTTPGNVGIGTATPGALLDVTGTAAQSQVFMQRGVANGTPGVTPIAQLRLRNPTSNNFFNFSFRMENGSHQVIQSAFDAAGAGGAGIFREFSFFDWTTRKYEIRNGVVDVAFLNTGTLSIGMGALPVPAGAKVAIGGKVVCKEIEVTLTGLPDFVFSSDYKLMSLYDVENFINTNKHLPSVPSAKEVVENGLNLGDMNATLLQKVEELTLYMINLQKENDALKARVSNLRNSIQIFFCRFN